MRRFFMFFLPNYEKIIPNFVKPLSSKLYGSFSATTSQNPGITKVWEYSDWNRKDIASDEFFSPLHFFLFVVCL